MVCFGDSITEFGNYPDIIAERTGMTVYNCGFQGTRLAIHGSPEYDKFSISKSIYAISNNNWTEQITANEQINYKNFDKLMNINFNEIDYVSIKDYLSHQDESTLDEIIDESYTPAVTRQTRIVSIIDDAVMNSGQAIYTRRMVIGK